MSRSPQAGARGLRHVEQRSDESAVPSRAASSSARSRDGDDHARGAIGTRSTLATRRLRDESGTTAMRACGCVRSTRRSPRRRSVRPSSGAKYRARSPTAVARSKITPCHEHGPCRTGGIDGASRPSISAPWRSATCSKQGSHLAARRAATSRGRRWARRSARPAAGLAVALAQLEVHLEDVHHLDAPQAAERRMRLVRQ